MFLAFEMRMLLSLPTTVAIAKAIQLIKSWIIGMDSPDFPTNYTTLVGNRVMALSE